MGGLHTRPVLLPQTTPSTAGPADSGAGCNAGIQLAVHPLAARALFGMPASELTGEVLELDDVIGAAGRRAAGATDRAVDPVTAAGLVVRVDR